MLHVGHARWDQTPDNLRQRATCAAYQRTRERFLALYEIPQAPRATQVAKRTGRHPQAVMEWLHLDNERGPEATAYQRTGGRPPLPRDRSSPRHRGPRGPAGRGQPTRSRGRPAAALDAQAPGWLRAGAVRPPVLPRNRPRRPAPARPVVDKGPQAARPDRRRAEFPGRTLVVIWDGTPCHRARAMWAAAASLGITLMPRPGYSPDLRPVEALWRRLREDVAYPHCHPTAEDLTRRVAAFEARVNHAPHAVADRLRAKDHLDPDEEKLRLSNLTRFNAGTIDFYPSPTRSAAAAKRFLAKAMRGLKWLGTAARHQHRQGAKLRRGRRRAEERRQAAGRRGAPAGQVPEQRRGSRPRQAEAADQAGARLQKLEDSLCDDQGFRGDAHLEKRSGKRFQSHPGHARRGPPLDRAFGIGADVLAKVVQFANERLGP